MKKVSSLVSGNITEYLNNKYTWSIYYNVKEHGAVGDGETDDFVAINSLLQDISGNATVIFPDGDFRIGQNMTIPENVFLYFVGGGFLQPDADITITVNGGIVAGAYPIFKGEGRTNGKPIAREILPQWWGAAGDGVTDDTEAIEKIRELAPEGSTIFFLGGSYLVTDDDLLTSPVGIYYRGIGQGSDFIYQNTSYPIPANAILASVAPDSVVITDHAGALAAGMVSVEELNYLSGVTSNIQGQLDSKGTGTVNSVTSTTEDIEVIDHNTDPKLTLNTGEGAHQIVKRDADGKVPGDITGQAETVVTNADLTGDVTSDGNVTELSPTGVEEGVYNKVTVDKKGRVTDGDVVGGFKVVSVPGEGDIEASAIGDTIQVTGGTGITITVNPATKELRITATGDATPGPHADTHITGGTDVIPDATGVASGLMSATDKSKLNDIEAEAQKNTVTSVAGRTGEVTVTKDDVGLGSVVDVEQAPANREINVGTGLSGGGDLTENRTIHADIATKAQAEAGTADDVLMSPERTAQAIDAKKEDVRTDVGKPLGVEVVSSFPNSPFNGQVVYHSGEEKFFGYANGEWV